MLSLIRPKKKTIYGIDNPVGLHNFIDTPSDKCLCNHGNGDTYYYLFLCPFFAARRATLASSVIQILSESCNDNTTLYNWLNLQINCNI